MQYTILSVKAKSRERGARWTTFSDFNNLTLEEINTGYNSVVIELTHPTFEEEKHFFLEDALSDIKDFKQTLITWISERGIESLPLKSGSAQIKTLTIDHADVWQAGFSVELTKMGTHPDNEWPTSHKRDLLLKHDSANIKDIFDYCIVSVNGLLHRTSYSDYGLYVVDGAHGKHEADSTLLSLTSFEKLGKVTQVDITSDMISTVNSKVPFYESVFLNLGIPTEGKTVLLSLGGYLHALDSTYRIVGDGIVKIDFNNYPMIQRYYESKDLIDLSSLEYTEMADNPDQRITKEMIESEQWIEQFLDLQQTFAIIVDTPSVYVEKHYVEKANLPGTFYYHSKPRWPLISQRGKIKEYWAKDDDGMWVLSCDSNLVPNYQFEHGFYREVYSVAPHKVPYKPYIYDRGFLLEISTEVI